MGFWAETGNRRYERSYRNKAGIMMIGARFLVREDVPLFSLVAVQSFSRGVVPRGLVLHVQCCYTTLLA